MKKTLLTLATICLASVQGLFAQERTVRGTVTDQDGKPLEYAVITVVGNDSYTAFTDENGNYELTVPADARDIKISYDTYGEKTVRISDQEITTSLSSVVEQMTEIEFTSVYGGKTGTMAKTNYVGSAERVDQKKFEKRPVTNIASAIEGNVAGVQVAKTSGQPGAAPAIRIRGYSSISGNSSPLYVVDGSVFMGDISTLNQADIATMDIMKDATATSLYGSRGANGVIIITTKSGRGNKKPQINVDAKVGMTSRAVRNYKVVKDPGKFLEFAWDGFRNQRNSANDLPVTDTDWRSFNNEVMRSLGGYNPYDISAEYLFDQQGRLNPNAKLQYVDDWDREIQRNGLRQDYNVSASGATDGGDYFLSLGYLNEKGYVKHSDYERITSRVNVNSKINDWLKTGLNLSGTFSTQNTITANNTAGGYNPFFVSRSFAPIYPVYYYNQNGSREIDPLTGDYKYDWGLVNPTNANSPMSLSSIGTRGNLRGANVLGSMALDRNRNHNFSLIAVPYLEAQFLKYFTFRTDVAYNYANQTGINYNNRYYGQYYENGGQIRRFTNNYSTYTWKKLLSFDHSILTKDELNPKAHNINIVAGHEVYNLAQNVVDVTRRGLPADNIYDLNGSAVAVNSGSYSNEDRMESYLAAFNYNFDSRYFFNANFRRDGSSRFAPSKRWGNFWSVGGGWIISNEKFMQQFSAINLLKVKGSYGTQGNNGTNYYGYHGLVNLDFANGTSPGAVVAQVANPNLTWESQNMLNLGLEFSINNRLRGEIGYYNKVNADQLYSRPFPTSTGVGSRLENVMTSVNSGVEGQLSYDILRPTREAPNSLYWNVSVNGYTTNNKITKMPDGVDSIIAGNRMLKVGESMYNFYLVESLGVNPETGDEMYRYQDSEGNTIDTSSYSVANATGRKIRAVGYDRVNFGFTNTLAYKNFEFSFLLTGGFGGKYLDGDYANLMGNGLSIGSNIHEDWLTDRWTLDNKSGTLPKAEYSNVDIGGLSTRFLFSRNYLNITNVSLAYTFPKNVLGNTFRSLRMYLSCDNAWIFTARQGMDPQSTFSGDMTGGASNGFPSARAFIFGVNVGL